MLFKSSARKARTTKNVSKIKSAELLMLQISIQWPLSIVLSPRSMRMYQFCFRHLLNCKVRAAAPHASSLSRQPARILCREVSGHYLHTQTVGPFSAHGSMISHVRRRVPVSLAPADSIFVPALSACPVHLIPRCFNRAHFKLERYILPLAGRSTAHSASCSPFSFASDGTCGRTAWLRQCFAPACAIEGSTGRGGWRWRCP